MKTHLTRIIASSALALLVVASTPSSRAADGIGGWFGELMRQLTEPFKKKKDTPPAEGTPSAPAPAVDADAEEDEYAIQRVPVHDPFEGFNRAMFKFNDGAYTYVVRPVSRGYEKAVPRPVRSGLSNFFDNIRYPVRFTGSVLQFKFTRAAKETGKFLVNTTAGLGGFVRVHNEIPALADVPSEDVGQAFGKWGIKPGPYLVVPLFGPTSTRDLFGRTGDYFLTPTTWHMMDSVEWEARAGISAIDGLSDFPDLLRNYDDFKASALDPYIAVRDGYLNYREAQVQK